MKDNYTMIEDYYYPDGSYYVIINTALGVFKGSTMPDEIDKEYLSQYHAAEIALNKALQKFSKAAIRQLKAELTVLNNLRKQAIDFAIDIDDFSNTTYQLVEGTIKQKRKELEKWEKRKQALATNLKERIAARDKIILNYKNRGQN